MGFRFFRRVKILPGVTLNLSGSGPSVSVGPRGLKTTFGPKGTRTTVGLPGTGLSYTEVHGDNHSPATRSGGSGCLTVTVLVLFVGLGVGLLRTCAASPPPPRVAPTQRAPVDPPTASARLRAAGLVAEFQVANTGKATAAVIAAFLGLPRENQIIHCAALWEEAFGPPPGPGELRLIREGAGRVVATFRYRAGKAEFRRLSAGPRR